jgi:hypothetical protein
MTLRNRFPTVTRLAILEYEGLLDNDENVTRYNGI